MEKQVYVSEKTGNVIEDAGGGDGYSVEQGLCQEN